MTSESERWVAACLGLAVLLGTGCRHERPAPLDPAPWRAWCARHLAADGRVIDDGQQGISHSEGQAYAMLLATAFDDAETFDRVWRWTREHLAVRDDGLLAWRWEATPDGGRITDHNNATDADILASWALIRGARRFGRPELLEPARRLARGVRRRAVLDSPYGPVLLPGVAGFAHDGRVIVNLSYWIYPAFRELASVDPSPVWDRLARSGRVLLARCRWGDAELPADWVVLDDRPAPSERFPARFGYDAIRIPLYLAWSGQADRDLCERLDRFWRNSADPPPAWIALDTGERGEPAPEGFLAVRALVRSCLGMAGEMPDLPDGSAGGYYSDTLALLARVAAREGAAR